MALLSAGLHWHGKRVATHSGLQTWLSLNIEIFFYNLPLKTAKLKKCKLLIMNPMADQKKSYSKPAVLVGFSCNCVKDRTLFCATLHFFATEKKDCTAIDILQLIFSKHFLISLYLRNAALEHLTKLSMLFQRGSFNFSHIQPALSIFQKKVTNLVDSDKVLNSLKFDWNKISKILLNSQSELLEDDIKLI